MDDATGKVRVDLDAEIVELTRDAVGGDSATDAAVVERALNAYLLHRLLDRTQTSAGASAKAAEHLAYTELRASRRERREVIRVVLDTGVYISALIGPRGSAPDRVLRAMFDDELDVSVCPILVDELERVLQRPKFDGYVDKRSRREFIDRVLRHAHAALAPEEVARVSRDRDDDFLVALAINLKVDALVTGDRDLLDAHLTAPQIWTPRELVDQLDPQ